MTVFVTPPLVAGVTLHRVTPPPEVELLFAGPGVRPESLDAREALELALAYVETLTAIAECDFGGDIPFRVALHAVKTGSARYVFTPIAEKADDVAIGLFDAAARKVDGAVQTPHAMDESVRPKALRLHDAAAKLPEHVSVTSRRRDKGAWKYSITDAVRGPTPARVRYLDTLRVRILRCGGVRPRVVVESETEGTLHLHATKAQASLAGTHLYQPADVDIELVREERPGRPIVSAKLVELRLVRADIDPVTAWDEWYEKAGRPGKELVEHTEGASYGKKKVRHG